MFDFDLVNFQEILQGRTKNHSSLGVTRINDLSLMCECLRYADELRMWLRLRSRTKATPNNSVALLKSTVTDGFDNSVQFLGVSLDVQSIAGFLVQSH